MCKMIMLFLSLSVLYGCGHHRDVRPSSSGKHGVSVMAETKSEASTRAFEQAKHYCKETNRQAFMVEEKFQYIGSVDESTYKKSKMLSKAAKSLGQSAFIFGGKKESEAGGVGMIGADAVDNALGNGYKVTMVFTCK